jgi:hypothetical protein
MPQGMGLRLYYSRFPAPAPCLLQPSDLYSEPYIQHFINNNNLFLKLHSYAGSYQVSADPNTHLVDLIVTFVSKANLHP